MEGGKTKLTAASVLGLLERRWLLIVGLVWLGLCTWFLYNKWTLVQGFALGDTDDNLRMAQVRALLGGQDWFDLRQYRLNPPAGADIHWSRLVDLPLAGLILLLRPLVGGQTAEMTAVAIAPMLPLLLLMVSLALIMRRLVDPRAFFLPFAALFFAGSASGMFMPLRIDHHGWQIAFLALGLAGLADPKRIRGGITLGAATALSLTIGMEMLIYLAVAAAATVLFWVVDREERGRLTSYAVTMAGGCAAGFLLFASYANRQPVCDALSPVWLSDALLGGALLAGLAWLSPATWQRRLILAALAAWIIAGFHAISWPQCLTRLEGVSPEVSELWLSNVREARPIFFHPWRTILLIVALPVTGAIGWALLAWVNRGDPDRLRRTLATAAPALLAALLLMWQTRTGPAAQALATAGAGALVWILVGGLTGLRNSTLRAAGYVGAIVIGLGAVVPLVLDKIPRDPPTARDQAIYRANFQCNSLGGLRPVAQQPKGIVFTFVDLGPRIITTTHHSAIIGPYHRNGEQIVDVMKAFRGSADNARATLAKYRADYLLTCPNSSTTTIFLSRAPNGFYAQLARGEVPGWLEPIALPANSPFRMWRVRR